MDDETRAHLRTIETGLTMLHAELALVRAELAVITRRLPPEPAVPGRTVVAQLPGYAVPEAAPTPRGGR